MNPNEEYSLTKFECSNCGVEWMCWAFDCTTQIQNTCYNCNEFVVFKRKTTDTNNLSTTAMDSEIKDELNKILKEN